MSLNVEDPPCEERTRAQLRADRNAGRLVPGGHYVVTDYNRQCVGEAKIKLHAVSPSILSLHAMVETTHDNSAWEGRYDLDTGRITHLKDNRGNQVGGSVGTEVDRFPWGNANLFEVTIEDADVLIDKETTFRIRSSRFESQSYTDLRGATGYIYYSSIESGARLELDAAENVRITSLQMGSRGLLYGERTTGLLAFYSSIRDNAQWNVRDRADVRLYYSKLDSSGYVRATGGTRHWIYFSEFTSRGTVQQLAGVLQIYYHRHDSYGELRIEAGAGTFIGYGNSYASRAYIRDYNTNRVRSYYNEVSSRGEQQLRDAADLRLYYNEVTGYGRLQVSGTTTIVYSFEVTSRAIVTITAANHYAGSFSTFARPTFPFLTRNVYGHGSWAQTAAATNINTGRDYFNNSLN